MTAWSRVPAVVAIEWDDSLGSSTWMSMDSAVAIAKTDPMRCYTVGLLLDEQEDYVLVTHSVRLHESEGADTMGVLQIPRVAIVNYWPVVLA